jgi:hypothetical protein
VIVTAVVIDDCSFVQLYLCKKPRYKTLASYILLAHVRILRMATAALLAPQVSATVAMAAATRKRTSSAATGAAAEEEDDDQHNVCSQCGTASRQFLLGSEILRIVPFLPTVFGVTDQHRYDSWSCLYSRIVDVYEDAHHPFCRAVFRTIDARFHQIPSYVRKPAAVAATVDQTSVVAARSNDISTESDASPEQTHQNMDFEVFEISM